MRTSTTSVWLALLIAFGGALAASGDNRLARLRILAPDYPRAFFFRNSEGLATNPRISYEDWDKTFSRLMGIEGKVLDEEVPGRSKRNIDFFARFKKAHPDQLVLLHYNGNARDPLDAGDRYFAGHWVYQEGAKIASDVPAQSGETEIRVSDARRFHMGIGRFKSGADDIGLFALKPDGQVDWAAAEQVQLIAVDAKAGTIRVRRACYGTRPRAFAAGKAYAAAHRVEGPWGNQSHLLWFYNFALNCPRDAQGRTCTDVLVDELGGRFQTGQPLESFDGLEFDVLRNGDARDDPSYGAGVIEFCRRLHEKMGPDKFLMADGWSQNNQRAFGILNGIEAEGWPALHDVEVNDWSGGINRQLFWVRNSAAPAFNYINHKFNVGGEIQKSAPMQINRLVFAGAMMTDSALCYSINPEPEPGERIGIWDELQMGTAHKPGWLGKPMGPAVHMAMLTKNLLDARTMATAVGLNVTVPAKGPDLVVRIVARAGKTPLLWNFGKSYSWLNEMSFPYEYYLDNVQGDRVTIEIKAEDEKAVHIESVEAYAHPDACYRRFEHGLVLANPSPRPYTFDLETLLPGVHYRRLQASAHQDPKTNDGSTAGAKVTVGPKDGLFLIAN
jgi:hypothetical protein